MFCGNCGSSIPDGFKFCPNCGFNLETQAQVQNQANSEMWNATPVKQQKVQEDGKLGVFFWASVVSWFLSPILGVYAVLFMFVFSVIDCCITYRDSGNKVAMSVLSVLLWIAYVYVRFKETKGTAIPFIILGIFIYLMIYFVFAYLFSFSLLYLLFK